MLGKRVIDNDNVESRETEIKCLEILDIETEFKNKKITGAVSYTLNDKIFPGGIHGEGYEIHYGLIVRNMEPPLAYIDGKPEGSVRGNIYGTNMYFTGITI